MSGKEFESTTADNIRECNIRVIITKQVEIPSEANQKLETDKPIKLRAEELLNLLLQY